MRKGFTLIELLITTTIIGLLSVTAATSLTYVRRKARDAKRVSDISAIRSAVEFYFEVHDVYPSAGNNGLVLGSENATMITDAGITSQPRAKGNVYLQGVPYNVLPGGVPLL
jgi:prepilin-type N-terminal cleavage/methylation domain-containing protein